MLTSPVRVAECNPGAGELKGAPVGSQVVNGLHFPADAHLDDLSSYLGISPSPYHAVANATQRLVAEGFVVLSETEEWPTTPGHYCVERGGALIAWSTMNGADVSHGFRIVGAHTDSPNLRLRPRPDHNGLGAAQLGVEIYGSPLLNSWLDRDLGLSGRVVVEGESRERSTVLVKFDEPLLRVPQLAIHLDRSISSDGLRLDPQRHLQPIWSAAPSTAPKFRSWLAERLGLVESSVLAWDLMTHDLTTPSILGVDETLFASSRIDNLLSCHAGLTALIAVATCTREQGGVPVLCLFDHEEVGSQTASGAASQFLPSVLERIALGAGLSREQWFSALASSFCVSADGAHATHPNWPERHEPDHPIFLDGGPVLKWNANARYGTDAPGAGVIRSVAREINIPLQEFVSRNDMPCGSTIGPVTATRLGIATVDIGVAQLSMHSARELTGVVDPSRFASLLAGVLARPTLTE